MKLQKYRELKKLTQEECADQLNITRQYYVELEKGRKPSRKLCEKIIEWSKKKITYSDMWNW